MPRLSVGKVPSYRKHKQSGQAIVTLNGRDHLLGPFNSKASREKYARLIGEWLAAGSQPLPAPRLTSEVNADALTVNQLVARFWKHAHNYYCDLKGKPTREAENYRDALQPAVTLYGRTPAQDFGPLALKAVREEMIRKGWARKHINRQILRVRSAFRWAVANELLPATTLTALESVAGLKAGKSRAKETSPVTPVARERVDAVLPHVSPPVAAMIQLQELTGMRSTEICIMRGEDIDRSGDTWVYRPKAHKTAHLGHHRIVYLGRKAHAILLPFFKFDPHAYIFSPAQAVEMLRQARTASRKTPLSCGNRAGNARKRNPIRTAKDHYDRHSYGRAITRGCELAFGMPAEYRDPAPRTNAANLDTPELKAKRRRLRNAWRDANCWNAHQLRHNAATRWRAEHGPEAALVLLGDKNARMIDVYAEKNQDLARGIMEKTG